MNFSAGPTNLKVMLFHSHDLSYYVSRRILPSPPLQVQVYTDPRVQDFTHPPDLWHHPRLANIIYAWSWKLCGITSAIVSFCCLKNGMLFVKIFSFRLRLDLRKHRFSSCFPNILYDSPICATHFVHIILPDFIIWTVFGEECKSLKPLMANFNPALCNCPF
jgi:hypothetical protein